MGMGLKTKKNIKEITLTSLVVSMVLYVISMFFYVDSHVNARELEFEKFSKTMAQYVLFFTSKLLESEVDKYDSIEPGNHKLLENDEVRFQRIDKNEQLSKYVEQMKNCTKINSIPIESPKHF